MQRAARSVGRERPKSVIFEFRTREELKTFLSPQDEYLCFGISQMVNTLFIISSISGSRERYSTISIDLPEIGHTSTFTGRQFSTIDLLGYDADEYNENVWLSGSCKAVVTVPC